MTDGATTAVTLPTRWHNRLHVRGLVVALLGSAILWSGIVLFGRQIVGEFVDHLLAERMQLARATAAVLDQVLLRDMEHIAHGRHPGEGTALADSVDDSVHDAVLVSRSRLFALADESALNFAALGVAGFAETPVELAALAKQAAVQRRMLASPLLRRESDGEPVFMLLAAQGGGRPERILVAEVPAATLLGVAAGQAKQAGLYLVDSVGRTAWLDAGVTKTGLLDHGAVLRDAVTDKRELHGRCHSCHTQADAQLRREDALLAMAPLPQLNLGIAVREDEQTALIPAWALRRRLWVGATVIWIAMMIIAGLAIDRVARPLLALRRAIADNQREQNNRPLPLFGQHEVGELARTFESWRGQLFDTLELAQKGRDALREQTDALEALLAAMRAIARSSLIEQSTEEILAEGGRQLLQIIGAEAVLLQLNLRARQVVHTGGFKAGEAELLLGESAALSACGLLPEANADEQFRVSPARVHCSSIDGGPLCDVTAHLQLHSGLRLCALLRLRSSGVRVDTAPLRALLHQLAMALAHQLLNEDEAALAVLRRDLLGKVMSAQEDERCRIARELHDTVSQDLAALRLELERLRGHDDASYLRGRLVYLEAQSETMLHTVRRLMLDLRPTVLDHMGFLHALRWHLEALEREHGLRTRLAVDGRERELPPPFDISLYRVFQEALANVVRHAEAEHVVVSVTFAAGTVELEIEDDGVGFVVDSGRSPSTDERPRLGILGMQERIKLMNGTLTLNSEPGGGARVVVAVPLPVAQEQQLAGDHGAAGGG